MWSKIAQQIVSEIITRTPPDRRGEHGERLDALYIGTSMWAQYYLRPLGDVVIVNEEGLGLAPEEWRTGRADLIYALIWGAERHPELDNLLPIRPDDAVDCTCFSLPLFHSKRLFCDKCGSLGWLPCVWLFNGELGTPSAVFSSRTLAETWIYQNRLTGMLTRYPLDISIYDFAISQNWFEPKKEYQKEPKFMGTFSSAHLEHYHYADGKPC